MWDTENFVTHERNIWYSKEEYQSLEEKLAKYEDILYNIYKAVDTCTPINYIEDFIEDEVLLERLEDRREKEFKEWKKKSLNVKNVK